MRLSSSLACVCLLLPSTLWADSSEPWTGFYSGGTLSFSTAETEIVGNRFTYNQNRAVNLVQHDYQGGGIGAYAGWNQQRGYLVAGIEASLNVDNLGSDLVFNSDNDIDQVEIKWSGAISGRVGFEIKNALIYAKGGLAFAKIRNVGGDVNGGVLTQSDAHSQDDILTGPTAALGVEHFVAKNWIARLEYSYTNFGRYTQANQDGAVPGSQFYRVNNGPVRRLSLGLAYKF